MPIGPWPRSHGEGSSVLCSTHTGECICHSLKTGAHASDTSVSWCVGSVSLLGSGILAPLVCFGLGGLISRAFNIPVFLCQRDHLSSLVGVWCGVHSSTVPASWRCLEHCCQHFGSFRGPQVPFSEGGLEWTICGEVLDMCTNGHFKVPAGTVGTSFPEEVT